jgi:hypothetical protein
LATRVRFCNWFINYVHNRLLNPKLTFFTCGANFNLSGYVNSKQQVLDIVRFEVLMVVTTECRLLGCDAMWFL